MSNTLAVVILGAIFFILGDIFGTQGVIDAGKQIISHFQ